MTQNSEVYNQTFACGPWSIHASKSHILQSRCSAPSVCSRSSNIQDLCYFCLYEKELELPQIPEMTFAGNTLKIEHEKGFGIEFSALGALKLVDNKHDALKVAVAEAWQESRMENSEIKEVIKPFDWTFSTHYNGTMFGNNDLYNVSNTEERIDIEKLKVKEKILFYADIMLFEDELADNGSAQCSVKIRIMPDSFFVLLRYFLRVDNLLVRIIDTRVYHELGNNYLLREHMTKESKTKDLKVSSTLLRNPQELWDHLPTVQFEYEKFEFKFE